MRTLLLYIAYTLLGIFFEHHEVITRPAYWAFYGLTFGVLISISYGDENK